MLRGGDELSHTQHGNNNAYCQDSEISLLHWDLNEEAQSYLAFCRKVIKLWHDQPVLKRRNFFQGRRIRGAGVKDIAWLNHTGNELTDDEWNSGCVSAIGVRMNGESIDEVDERGEHISGDTLLILFSNQPDSVTFKMPRHMPSERWVPVFDTSRDDVQGEAYSTDDTYPLDGRSVAVLILAGGWPDTQM